MRFIKLIGSYYNRLSKEFRFRCNYQELKVSDTLTIACPLAQIDLRELSEAQFHVASSLLKFQLQNERVTIDVGGN